MTAGTGRAEQIMRSVLDAPRQWILKSGLFEGKPNRPALAKEHELAVARFNPHEERECEWLTARRDGTFAMGSVDRVPRRKYHSLLSQPSSSGQLLNLVSELGERIELPARTLRLHRFRFGRDAVADIPEELVDFSYQPWPSWSYDLGSARIRRRVELVEEQRGVCVHYRVEGVTAPFRISLLPFLGCRGVHELAQMNPVLNGEVRIESRGFSLQPYRDLPRLYFAVEGHEFHFVADGLWYKNVDYSWERERGYASAEDLYVPGELSLTIAEHSEFSVWIGTEPVPANFVSLRSRSTPPLRTGVEGSKRFCERLERALPTFKIRQRGEETIIGGYPWFAQRSRDALLALRGIYLARGDRDGALTVLENIARSRVGGLIPNDPELGLGGIKSLEVDAVDTTLLFIDALRRIVAVRSCPRTHELMTVVCSGIEALSAGQDPRAHLNDRGEVLIVGGPWVLSMGDVLVDGVPVANRHGFLVEVNALFIGALQFALPWAAEHAPAFANKFAGVLTQAKAAFLERFTSDEFAHLADRNDGHITDFSVRPYQLWALASEAVPLTVEERARALEVVSRELVTPVGLRTLSQFDGRYQPNYQGNAAERDRSYCQGSVWPWLLGLYADAVLLVHGDARLRDEFEGMQPRLEHHFDHEGLVGQFSECFDGGAPHFARGAPAHAPSVAELYRIAKMVGA